MCDLDALTPLQAKALEHAATVLALELVKERAAQQVEWQLQGDLLSELLDAGDAARAVTDRPRPPPRRRPRARAPDRRRPLAPTSWPTTCSCSCAARPGAGSSTATPSLVCLRGEHVVLAARDAEPVVRAVTAAAEREGVTLAIGVSDVCDDLATAYRQAVRLRAARAAAGGVVHAERLGPLRFMLDAPDVSQVRAVVTSNSARCSPTTAAAPISSPRCARSSPPTATSPRPPRPASSTRTRCAIASSASTDVLGRDPAAPDVKFHLRMAFDLVDLFAGMGIDLLPARATSDARA